MSITSSFFSGLSGLDTHGRAMQVIGDNIANVNTTGFKSSSVHFEDVLGVSLTGVTGGSQTGAGAKISSVDRNFIQGSLETTDVSTDIAINGRGFFIMGDPSSNQSFYTRIGHFHFDNQGYYVNNQGYRVKGYYYDSTGTTLYETLNDIKIDQQSMIPPQVTGKVQMALNLNAQEDPLVWNISNPTGTSHFSTSFSVFDSLGQSHRIQVFFNKSDEHSWVWNAAIEGSDVKGGTPGQLSLYGSGALAFDNLGQLQTPMPSALYTAGDLIFANGLTPPATQIDFTETTHYGSASAIKKIHRDGYASGTIAGVGIDEEGNITANYTNGTRKKLARIALAGFSNLSGLLRKGSAMFQATTSSGDPIYNKPGIGGLGAISASMLEKSNVDLAAEFIKMIIIQRGYQANTKVITTTDEMLAQLINIR